jgi:hypothetical protein
MKKRKGKKMYGGRTWDEWARENKIGSTALGVLSGLAGVIPGVNALVSPALAGLSGATKLAGYGRHMNGGAVYTKGQVPLHKMSGAGLRGMVGGSSVYNNVGSAYGRIRV